MIYHNVFQFKYWENEDLLKLDVRVYLFLFIISLHWVVIKVFILVSMNPVEYWYLYHIKYQEISSTELMIKYNWQMCFHHPHSLAPLAQQIWTGSLV